MKLGNGAARGGNPGSLMGEMVANGDFDVIILQESVYNLGAVEKFYENIRMWVTEIRSVGAVPVLYMPNPVEGEVSIDDIAQAHSEIAAELGLHIAWETVLEYQATNVK